MALLLKSALDHAGLWHAGQFRKYPDVQVPYLSHLAGVVAVLARHGFDEEVLAAGALHDCVEDRGVTFETLERQFGRRVAGLVRDCSEEDKKASWEERKRAYLEHFKVKPWEAQAITLADKIDNFQSIAVCKKTWGDPWAMFKRPRDAQLARFRELEQALEALPPHPLVDEYRRELAALEGV